MSNIEVKFVCEPSKYSELRDRDVWIDIFKKLQILKSTVKDNKGKWVERIVKELKNCNKRDDIEYVDTEDVLIINFYRTEVRIDEG